MKAELIKTNQETWLSLLEYYENDSRDLYWEEHRLYGLQLLKYGIEQGFDRYFRAGSSAYSLFGHDLKELKKRLSIQVPMTLS